MNKPRSCFFLFFLLVSFWEHLVSQSELNYFLPDIVYDVSIPTPTQYLESPIGTWHPSYDQIAGYFKALSQASPKVKYVEYARSHEHKPLFYVIITNEVNFSNLDHIKTQHQKLAQRTTSKTVDITTLPAILWQGYSIHGNESSGSSAAMLVAYYLAAGKSREIETILSDMVILIDPCLNPDGIQRFSTWVNSHKSLNLVSDAASREFDEVWPGGRYNHYWSDLNRDYLMLVHPESRGRIKVWNEWNPNVVGDYHEMGTNSTYFFMPGVPSRNNPNTPSENFDLTEKIAVFHAKALDSIGSKYFTKERYDDFYYGKGSTYPDAIGAIGILFEQASSRGHLQESKNGNISFAFTIRNQINTSLSTQRGLSAHKMEILQFKKDFFTKVKTNFEKNRITGYVFTADDEVIVNKFLNLLLDHNIEVFAISRDISIADKHYPKAKSYFVPLDQNKPIIAQTMFEEVTNFQDSVFYDVSGWTIAHGYGLDFDKLFEDVSGKKITTPPNKIGALHLVDDTQNYFIISSSQYNYHKSLYELLSNSVKMTISSSVFYLKTRTNSVKFPKGSAIIHIESNQNIAATLKSLLEQLVYKHQLVVYGVQKEVSADGIPFGYGTDGYNDIPKVAFLVGDGIMPQSAGEVWYHIDQNLGFTATALDITKWQRFQEIKYTTMIIPSGNLNVLKESQVNQLKEWIKNGNTVICLGESIHWLVNNGFIRLTQRTFTNPNTAQQIGTPSIDLSTAANRISGSIFRTNYNPSHPIFFGFSENKKYLSMRSGTKFYESTTNPLATPSSYSRDYLASGYVPKSLSAHIESNAVVTTHRLGQGRILCFHDNPLFRNYWISGQNIFNNALFFSHLIPYETLEELE